MGDETRMIRRIEVENKTRLIVMFEKLGTIVAVGGFALAGMWLGVIDTQVLHVLLPYLGLRAGESVVRGPAAKLASRVINGNGE